MTPRIITRPLSWGSAVIALAVFSGLTLAAPAAAQSVGGLGQRPRGGDDNAPRPAPTPPPAAPDPKPDPPKPDPPAPAPEAPPPAPEPPALPAPEPPAPAPPPAPVPERETRPVPPPAPPIIPEARRTETGPARSVRVTTPVGQRPVPRPSDDGNYLYSPPVIVEVPVPVEYPVPADVPDAPVYTTLPQPFPPAPAVLPPAPAERPGAASPLMKEARPATVTFASAFADIERAWADGKPALIRKHVHSDETKITVSLRGKYAYSLTSGDFLRITRLAFRRLTTISFRFTRLRHAMDGDVTAYGRHVYRLSASAGPAGKSKITGHGPALRTVFVSYTLRRQGGIWVIVGVDSAPTDLVK